MFRQRNGPAVPGVGFPETRVHVHPYRAAHVDLYADKCNGVGEIGMIVPPPSAWDSAVAAIDKGLRTQC